MSPNPPPFTVADALQLEVFQAARVVAGASGLGRAIQWVHIVEIADIQHWVKGGELLLTDAHTLTVDHARHPDLIAALYGLGIAGIVFSPIGEVAAPPTPLLHAAERLGLPIIEVPYEFHYVELTETLLRRLVDREGALIRHAMNIHLRLTRVVLQGGDLGDLARALAELVMCSVHLETPEFLTLAYAAWPTTAAPARPPALGRLAEAGWLRQLCEQQKPARLTAALGRQRPQEWIVAPIMVGGEVLGYLTLREAGRRLNDLDLQAVESAATVAALILARQRAIEATEARFQGDLLAQLVDGTFRENAPTLQNLARYGLNGEREHQVLALELDAGSVAQDPALLAALQRVVAGLGLNALAGTLGRRWVCILEYRREPGEGAQAAQQLSRLAPQIRIGLGEAGRGWAWLHTSYQQAVDALTIVSRLPSLGRQTATFAELGFLHWLLSLSDEARAANPYSAKIERLRDQDRRRGNALLATLETYLEAGGNGQRAARALHIHRSTLNYRLKRITQLCGVDLADPLVRLNLHLALKAHQLRRP